MRLINARTKKLEEFFGDCIPKYAILSHTWGADEISFQELRDYYNQVLTQERGRAGITGDAISNSPLPAQVDPDEGLPSQKPGGWMKIVGTCALALGHELEYAWIDTCCIDKTSSAELQEAINSMFRWYQNSEICFAFLSDIDCGRPAGAAGDGSSRKERQNEHGDDQQARDHQCANTGETLVRSRWFTRGWTLQELIAPHSLKFYNRHWDLLGDLWNFTDEISRRTGVSDRFLAVHARPGAPWNYQKPLSKASVAERLSWAASRQTTRVEDRAYSLLGIFNITMPLLYGEGEKAFERLQEEIMKVNVDISILAWGFGRYEEYYSRDTGESEVMLARSPDDYEHCGKLALVRLPVSGLRSPELSTSPRGLRAHFSTITIPSLGPFLPGEILFLVLGKVENRSDFTFRLTGKSDLLVLPVFKPSLRMTDDVHNLFRRPFSLLGQTWSRNSDLDGCHRFPWAKPEIIPYRFLQRLGMLREERVTIVRPASQFMPGDKFDDLPFSLRTSQPGFGSLTGVFPYPIFAELAERSFMSRARRPQLALTSALQRLGTAKSSLVLISLAGNQMGNIFHRFEVPGMPDHTVLVVLVSYYMRNGSASHVTLRVFCMNAEDTFMEKFWQHGHGVAALEARHSQRLGMTEIPAREGSTLHQMPIRIRSMPGNNHHTEAGTVAQGYFALPTENPKMGKLTLKVERIFDPGALGPENCELNLEFVRSDPAVNGVVARDAGAVT
jgi:hypothetical protein